MNLIVDRGLKESLKPEIDELNRDLETFSRETDGFLGDLLSYVLINSGKRIRPALVFLGSQLGGANGHDVRTVEIAVELIHIATLVHDDVIDKAALRRGRKTVVEQQGVDTAVLLGDHIYTTAFQRVAALNRPTLLALLAESTSLMCQGEIEQLKNRYQFTLSESDYFSFIEKKTASLFGTSIRSGAILAGQPKEIQMELERYGVFLGMAFQITDDLLDLTGDESVVGKTLHTDLNNGKMTLPLIHFRNQLESSSDREEFLNQLKSPNGHIAALIKQVGKAGSIDYADQIAQEFIHRAVECLTDIPSGPVKDHLISLAEMLHRRKS